MDHTSAQGDVQIDNFSNDHSYDCSDKHFIPNTHDFQTIQVLSLNCRSIRSLAKRGRLAGLIQEHQADIIIGCETHIDESYSSSEIFPPNYTVLRKDRKAGGGGVFLCFNQMLNVTEEPSLQCNAELIWGKIKLHNKKPLYVCSFYRPPTSTLDPILELNESLNKLFEKHRGPSNIILAGDFNLPSIMWIDGCGTLNTDPTYGFEINSLFLDLINNFGLEQLIQNPTRGSNILDLLLTTQPQLLSNIQVVPGISDHEAITFHLCPDISRQDKPKHKVFLYHKSKLEAIRADMLKFQESFFQSDPYSKSVETNWIQFKATIMESITNYVPQKTCKSSNDLPWLTHDIRKLMRSRRHWYDRAKISNSDSDWTAYRKTRNLVNSKLEVAHSSYQARLFDTSFSGNKRQFWKYVRAMRRQSFTIPSLVCKGKELSTARDKASALNTQFESVFTNEDLSNMPNKGIGSFADMPTITFSNEGIEKLLLELDTNKAPGPDRIPCYILKHCASEISPILRIIFEQSLSTSSVPKDWLTANITAIYKKGDRSSPANYRPISLTSVCCKVMEHIIYHSIMEHLQHNNILTENQHGFRRGFSCQTQLISVIEDVLHAMDNRDQVDLILLDFAKAFDKVPHQRLLSKLLYYRIDNTVYNWIKVWLTQRSQCVQIDGVTSNVVSVKSGVPQGTVLGPLMFLLYINDISDNISSSLRLFADDCLMYRVIKSAEDVHRLQNDLDVLAQWASLWQMNFNTDKCIVLKCSRNCSLLNSGYTLNGHILGVMEQHSYLGVILQSRLSWLPHINTIINKASKTLNFIKRNLYKCSTSVKASAYLSLVRPLLEYASTIWDPYQRTYIQALEKIQRRAARWVTADYSRTSSVTTMLTSLQWPTLELRRKISRLQLFHKAIYGSVAMSIPQYFQQTQRPTRNYHPLHLIQPQTLTSAYQQSFYPRTVKEWNSLPTSIIEITDNTLFCTTLHNHIANY